MVTLISRWKLRDGCPPELADTLRQLAAVVQAQEPGTLAYVVHLGAPDPLAADGAPRQPPAPPYAPAQQTEVVFVEMYRDAEAFSAHLAGDAFKGFVSRNLQHFYEDPETPGRPNAVTVFLERESAFIRPDAG
ncbi:MAG TPA: antibiotic biosynthesis monooxygenase family protein [Longimicrobiaceae bacterium]|nr:antibiotic biosynthesis monooxygenase family protein [Longimicrobiaceae bacterium]